MHNLARSVKHGLKATLYCAEVLTRYRHLARPAWVDDRLAVLVQKTPSGSLLVPLRDHGIGRPLYTGQGYEPDETEFVQKTLRPGMTVIDGGGNIGYFALLAAACVGPSGSVLTIEPDPDNLQLLTANVARQKASQVIICRCAVGDKPGTARLTRSDWNTGDHRVNAPVECARDQISVGIETIDRLVSLHRLSRVDLIKLDIQGYEPFAVAGMDETLERFRPTLLVELWPYGLKNAGRTVDDVVGPLFKRGYSAYLPMRPTDRRTTIASVRAILGPSEATDSYANLVFCPPDRFPSHSDRDTNASYTSLMQ